jgi:hypothetical protein
MSSTTICGRHQMNDWTNCTNQQLCQETTMLSPDDAIITFFFRLDLAIDKHVALTHMILFVYIR